MKIIYSSCNDFDGVGIGYINRESVIQINNRNLLSKAFCLRKTEKLPADKQISLPAGFLLDKGLKIFGYYNRYLARDYLFGFFTSIMLGGADILHLWCGYGGFIINKARRLGITTVLERANAHILEQKRILEDEYKRIGIKSVIAHKLQIKQHLREYNEADYILVPSDYVKRSFVDRGFSGSKIMVLPYGVDSDKFSPLKDKKEHGKFSLLYVGQISVRKGIHVLLESWEDLDLNNAELILAGPVMNEIIEFIKMRKLKLKNVLFKGLVVDALSDLYKKSSAFILPSFEDGYGMVAAEAMASGLPVIVSRNAGVSELVRDSVDGFIINPEDKEGIKEKILFLYYHRNKADELGANASKRSALYSWDNFGDGLIRFYKQIAR